MLRLHQFARIGLCMAGVTLAGASWSAAELAAEADAPSAAPRQIYQQRTADGRVVLTDRPQPTATTERTWQTVPEDAHAGRARREEARLAAQAINERIARQVETQRQRDLDLEIERLRLSAALADADAARVSALAAAQPIAVLAPGFRRRLDLRPHSVLPRSARISRTDPTLRRSPMNARGLQPGD